MTTKKVAFKHVTLDDVISAVDPSAKVAFDVETNGFYGEIILAQFYQEHWPEVLMVVRPDPLNLATAIRAWPLVAHSMNYEIHTVQRNIAAALGQKASGWVPNDCDCTLLLSRLYFCTELEHSLDLCYKYMFKSCIYTAHGLDKATMQKFPWKSYNPAIHTNASLYAALDVFYLLDLYKVVSKEADSTSYKIDKRATLHISKLQRGGLAINEEKVRAHLANNIELIKAENVPINVNSYQQVRPYIGETTSDDDALALHALNGNERAAKVRTVRKLTKQNSFLTSYLEEAQDGRIYGLFNFLAKSGRGRCQQLNLQQLPRAFKYLFEPPKGRVRVTADYSQLELRMACAYTGETRMASLFKSGEDLHIYTGERMQAERQVGKTCNFNLIYGGSANMLQTILMSDADTLLPIEQVRDLKKRWHNLWPTMTAWQDSMSNVARRGGTVQTVLGRTMRPKIYTDAMNLPIQGSSAEVAKLALHYMVLALEEEGLMDKVLFCNFVHDMYDWECDDDPAIYKPVAKIVGDSMREAWYQVVQFTKIPDLPMPVSVEVGGNLKTIESDAIYVYKV